MQAIKAYQCHASRRDGVDALIELHRVIKRQVAGATLQRNAGCITILCRLLKEDRTDVPAVAAADQQALVDKIESCLQS